MAPLFSFLFGLVLGSFLNVCIFRLPRERSIVRPPSSCPQCGHRIRFYDNIPVLSYILLRGKCRSCRAPIPIHYPVVELVTGLLSLSLFLRYGPSFSYGTLLIFSSSLVVISFIDLHHKIIPDIISLPGIAAGFLASLPGWTGTTWSDSLIGVIGGGGFLFLIALLFKKLTGKEGMGGGDVKLLAMIGAWLGWRSLPFVILTSSLAGILIGGLSLLVSGKGLRSRIPFGPFLALGSLMYLYFGEALLIWYLGMLSGN
ncbi:MAG: prepilin peptidase [Deltaproteobacteria bacterium]|nr:prepilin peptidase [Deltaproteobacteria bacterium]MBW2016976.1 prepilin peptidase [Deltaproteobacteria bacterium]MBW2129369.1 prepilin peptidase [Deltaproteobacteria bacterium]MBW2303710.1 prepilin peptidase [Deltaproteobacteria bacterium]